MRDQVEYELRDMLQNGIIKFDDETKYNSPLVIVKKPGGKIRLVNNFIKLNEKTVNEQYLMKNPSDILSRVAGSKYATKIDLQRCFFQVPLSEESQKLTGFQTPFGTFSYSTMPMGLRCASGTAQRLLDCVLRGAHRFASSLIDDILIWSKNFSEHLEHIKFVLDRLRNAGLTVNTQKCTFGTTSLKLFGFVVEEGKITPDPEKLQPIKTWPIPRNRKQLKSFLGYTNYFRQHISHYAQIAFPLTELLSQAKPDKLQCGTSQQ